MIGANEMLQKTWVRPSGEALSVLVRAGMGIGSHPATVFLLLSFLFGTIITFANPPLRGPDEIAHFLRIYSYTKGELRPAMEVDGRKGTLMPRELFDDVYFFKDEGERFIRQHDLRYGTVMAAYRTRASTSPEEFDRDPKFAAFAGTEGYNPFSYFPYIAGAAIGRLLALDFVDMLHVMRLCGVAAFTVMVAYAIAVTPVLKWAFVLIGMLPASLYNRSVLSADGAALSYVMVITALCLSATRGLAAGRFWERSLWMTLCVLAKPPQIVFGLLEFMVRRFRNLRRGWAIVTIVVAPGLILTPLWVLTVDADVASWRVLDGGKYAPEHFDPLWKLGFMWENPFHFPHVAWAAICYQPTRLWQELIGIIAWQDVWLWSWTYPVLTLLLLVVQLERLGLDSAVRARATLISGLAIVSYVVLVYLIFFLTWTPPDSPMVWGVQGRYFVVALPVAAIFVASVANFGLPRWVPAGSATAGSLVAGIATVEALLRTHW